MQISNDRVEFRGFGSFGALNDGTLDKTLGYGAQNREISVSGGTALTYDYKGNVTVRPPLDGSAAYNYTWNVYDRLTQVTRTGQTTVNYDYDIGGRLLRRTKGDEVMVNYWLGLNKIAEERWGSESGKSLAILRPDSEASSSPGTNGWIAGGSGSMSYATDSARGKVLNLSSDYNDFLIGGDPGVSLGTAFNDSSRKHLGLWIKNADGDPFTITVIGATENYPSYARLKLISASGTDITYEKYIGTAWNDGAWHYLEFDLAALIAVGGDVLTRIDGLLFSCEVQDLYVDDIVLSGGALEKSYAQNPSSAIRGNLGIQTGNSGSTGISAWGKYYYHFNDLGTMVASTNSVGAKIGVYEPDLFGRYRYDNGIRPDSMGITSNIYDLDSDFVYCLARWYDQERGRFVSKEPLKEKFINGESILAITSTINPQYMLNSYHYSQNDPMNFADPNGEFALPGFLLGAGAGCAINGTISWITSWGNSAKNGWKAFGCGCIGGAVSGAILGASGGLAAGVGAGAAGAAAERVCNCGLPSDIDELKGMGTSVVIGATTGAIGVADVGSPVGRGVVGGSASAVGGAMGSIVDDLDPECCK